MFEVGAGYVYINVIGDGSSYLILLYALYAYMAVWMMRAIINLIKSIPFF